MLPNAHAEENVSHTPPHRPAVFLTHASPPSHIAADSEPINSAFVGSRRNRWVRGVKGFNRRVSISVLLSKARDIRPIGAPKLSAGAAGIESVRYDFDKISFEPEAHQPLAEVTFPASIKNNKERDPVQRDFLGKKVTSLSHETEMEARWKSRSLPISCRSPLGRESPEGRRAKRRRGDGRRSSCASACRLLSRRTKRQT